MSKVINEKAALKHLMELLAIEGVSGQEREVAACVRQKLKKAECRATWIRHDDVHRQIPDFEIGNLIVKLPGTRRGPRRLFVGHLDTVPLCRGARPIRRGNRIVAKGRTALGGDNRTSVACLVTLAETLLKRRLPHPPLTLLLTVGEEIGLVGSSRVRLRDLGLPKMGFNVDAGRPGEIIVGASGADRWQAEVFGRPAHAGVHPDHGVSASLIASRAIADVARRGYFGKVVKGKKRGTSNVGIFRGGEATNQVTDYVTIRGESRSHDASFLKEITGAYREAFQKAAQSVRNRQGKTGRVRFQAAREYEAFQMDRRSPTAQLSYRVAQSLRLKPQFVAVDGGLDATSLNAKGLPTVTVGAGHHRPHTLDEYVDVREFLTGCRLVVALATAEV
jgi:tripeptide aminopeptidase